MKVFIADRRKRERISKIDYHWCDDNDLLMFGQFQGDKENPSEVGMCGIKSRRFTTHIYIKEIEIDKTFYKEMIIDSIEHSMNCSIDEDGDYGVEVGFQHQFNVNNIIEELLEKANKFSDGQKVTCLGRILTKTKK